MAARCAGEGWVVAEELPADAPAIAPATAVPRRRGLSTTVFKQEHFKTDTPVVLEDLTDAWGARARWADFRYLRRVAGHRTVPVEVGRIQGGRKLAGWREEAMPLSELLGSHLAPSNLRCRAGEPAAKHEAQPSPRPSRAADACCRAGPRRLRRARRGAVRGQRIDELSDCPMNQSGAIFQRSSRN